MTAPAAPAARALSVWKGIVFALVPAAALLVAAELVVRWTGAGERCWSPFTEKSKLWDCDPILQFRTRRDLVVRGKPMNSLGFRSRELGPKPADAYRIVALGDSCTFGMVPMNRGFYVRTPYPQGLEELAAKRAPHRPVEVLNAGVCGYNSFHGLMLLRTRLRDVDADLVTVRYGWNDILATVGTGPDAYEEPSGFIRRQVQGLLLRTALYGFAKRLSMPRDVPDARKPVVPSEKAQWKPTVPLERYKTHLRRIAEVASAAGAETWFLTVPDAFMTTEHALPSPALAETAARQLGVFRVAGITTFEALAAIHASYNEATRAVGAELGVPVVDMEPAYRANAHQRLFDASDVIHPLQAGHDLEAEVLYTELVARGVIEAAGATR